LTAPETRLHNCKKPFFYSSRQEEVQQTEIRRRELDIERKKLEDEIAKYQKSGKQPKNSKQGKEKTSRSSIISLTSRKSEVGGR
jgi:hypothetical protein